MKRGSVLSLIQPKMWKRCILHFEKSGWEKHEVSLNWEGNSLRASPIHVQVPSPKCPYLASPDLDMGNKMAPKTPKASATQAEACQSCGVSTLPLARDIQFKRTDLAEFPFPLQQHHLFPCEFPQHLSCFRDTRGALSPAHSLVLEEVR